MSYSEFDQSPLARFVRVVSRSFRLGRAFGVEVRMYWVAAILMPLIFLRWMLPVSGTALEAAFLTTVCVVGLFAVVWTHEMGHIAMGRRHGIPTNLITLSPLGGAAHLSAPAPGPWAELKVALAGPAVHLAWLVLCWPLWKLLPSGMVTFSAWRSDPIGFTLWFLVTTNAFLLAFNLLPVFALDGGRALRALLATRVHPNRATLWATTVGFVGAAGMILVGISRSGPGGMILVVIGLSCIQACLYERRWARAALVYDVAAAREPWATDPDAWRHAARPQDARPRRPGMFARWRQRRAQRRSLDEAAERRHLDAELDAILARISEVGMRGLSAREKATLARASRQRRGTG